MPHKHVVKGKWTGKWMGQVKWNGIRDRKLFPTKAGAVAWEVDKKRKANEPSIQTEPRTKIVTVSLIDWANKYLDYAVMYSPKTYSEKKNIFRRLKQAFGEEASVESITPGKALDYLQEQFRARSGHAANKERKNLITAWKHGVDFIEGFPNRNPFKIAPKLSQDAHPRYVPSWEDFCSVVDVAEGQDKIMLIVFLHTAARRGELYRLKWSDVDFDNRTISLTTRKRKSRSLEPDELDMGDELFDALRDHRQTAMNEWVFVQRVGRHHGKPYVENRGFPQELCDKAGVKPFGCHGIRHLSASILAKHNVAMVDIQGHLRHQKLATTEGYVHRQGAGRSYLKVLEGGFLGKRSNDGSNNKNEGLRESTS